MANQIAENKQRVYLVLDKSLIAQIDGRAAAVGSNRTAVIVDALTAYFADGSAGDAAAARLDAISAKLDALAAQQEAAKADAATRATLLLDAVKSQPIAVQQQLPAPELTRENVTEWLKANEPNAVALDCWGEPSIKREEQQPQQRTKSRFARAVDALLGQD